MYQIVWYACTNFILTQPYKVGKIINSIYRWRNWGLEKLHKLLKAKELISRARTWSSLVQTLYLPYHAASLYNSNLL